MVSLMLLPTLVVHADWSVSADKRWLASARVNRQGRFTATAPQPVGAIATLLPRLRAEAEDGAVLLGVDFPLGLPLVYAQRAGVTDFRALLPRLGRGRWSHFYEVAAKPEEINLQRPFYPRRPGGTRQHHLLQGLGVADIDALRRRCERAQPGRRAAAPLFWTLGAQQVGKAAICGWRELLAPAMRRRDPQLAIWPFDGPLLNLLQPGRIVVAETYPADAQRWLGLSSVAGSKRDQEVRRLRGERLTAAATARGVTLTPALVAAVADGFGADAGSDDRYDAVVGLLGMLEVLTGRRLEGYPPAAVRRIEGGILGQAG
jgi:hypothetical protein